MDKQIKTEKITSQEVATGDLIRVSVKVKEGGKERIQVFEGTIIGIKGRGTSRTFTVRKIASGGIGVERIWPFSSPFIKDIQLVKKRPQKKSKIFYLRKLKGKEATGAYL